MGSINLACSHSPIHTLSHLVLHVKMFLNVSCINLQILKGIHNYITSLNVPTTQFRK